MTDRSMPACRSFIAAVCLLSRERDRRHSFATLMLANGTDIRCIQQLPAHAKLDTAQIYAQVSIRKLKQVHTLTHPAKMKADMVDDNTDAEFT